MAEQIGPDRTWQVLVVEDDSRVAPTYAKVIKATAHFDVAGIVTSGEDALALMSRRPCDLLVLDLYLGGMDGLTLLRRLRASRSAVEAIAVTGRRDAAVVRSMIQLGVIDYLVKPFAVERLRQSLGLFLNRAAALYHPMLDQASIDRATSAGRMPRRWLPKGLTQEGLAQVVAALDRSPCAVSSADVAERTGMARVTVRRYLEYLVATERASVDAPASGPGRPRKLYHTTGGCTG
jgi:response regulator of citrate/malate metabolism